MNIICTEWVGYKAPFGESEAVEGGVNDESDNRGVVRWAKSEQLL